MTLPSPAARGGFGRQASRDLVKGGGDRHDDLPIVKVPRPAPGVHGVEKRVLEVLQVAARGIKRRKLFLCTIRPPGKRALLRIDVRVRQPGLGGAHHAVGHERAMVSGELANDPRLPAIVPWQRECPRSEFLRVRQVQRGRQCQLFAQLVGCQDLRNWQNFGPIGFQISQRHRAVARAEVNPETEASLHGTWRPADVSPDDWAYWAAAKPRPSFHFHLRGSNGG